MQRTYKPIAHDIFSLHTMLEHLVCRVWCDASNENTCLQLLNTDFEQAYNAYPWLKEGVDDTYELCKLLTQPERASIREAFYINNRIEDLCSGIVSPIELNQLPLVVEKNMKPLLEKFYSPLLDRAEIPGSKLDYYNSLVSHNKYSTCPCCGLARIEPAKSHYVEDNDHFFPKAYYPFAAVNFQNLVPICDKCNKKHKSTKKPLDHNGLSYYPFSLGHIPIEISIEIFDNDNIDYRNLMAQDIEINFTGDTNKNSTWDWLFNIKARYKEEICDFAFNELRTIKNRFFQNRDIATRDIYNEIIDFEILNYDADKYTDRKFLKASFLKAIKEKPEWQSIFV